MSKKLAEGSTALVLDVKCGDGAFMKSLQDARRLAETMVAIGNRSGVPTEALVTDMDDPLGAAVGNALEVIECLETLKGQGSKPLAEIAVRLASRMIVLGGVETSGERAMTRAAEALSSGRALDTFGRMIEAQGGDRRVIDDYTRLPSTPDRDIVAARRGGYVTAITAEAIGRASNDLGAGRNTVHDSVDHGVGVVLQVAFGDRVEEGQPVIELHHRNGRGLVAARRRCEAAVRIGDAPAAPRPEVLAEVRG
jgi:thymidine phosphorylase